MSLVVLVGLILFSMWMIRGYIQIIRMDKTEDNYVPDISLCESPIERRVYRGLVINGLYPTPQYKVGRYRIDLAFPYQKLAIECDGKAHHSSASDRARDKRKDKFLRENGWTVLRFSGRRIHRDLSGVVRKIKESITNV